MIAKTDRTNSERWLPLWMHSYDTAGVMEYLYHNWLPLAVIKVISKDFREEMGLKVCLFLAYIHDAGKLCSQFQSGVAEQVRDIREKLFQEAISLASPKNLTKKIPHPYAGKVF